MPELPEVQVVINYLSKNILNQKINDILVIKENSKVLKNVTIEEFKKQLIDTKINSITRNGKYLIFHLNNQKIWIVHLRMTGTFSIHSKDNKESNLILKSTIALFYFDNFILRFDSSRKFSTFDVIDENEYDIFLPRTRVNLDPLSENCDAKFLYNQIHKLSRNIKSVLLDQAIISGIGNIYADEILFECRLHPNTQANKLKLIDCENIIFHAKRILKESIKHNGTTVHSFSFNGVDSGKYQDYLKIHHSKIKKCNNCDSTITFFKMNGRGTYCCLKCQKLK